MRVQTEGEGMIRQWSQWNTRELETIRQIILANPDAGTGYLCSIVKELLPTRTLEAIRHRVIDTRRELVEKHPYTDLGAPRWTPHELRTLEMLIDESPGVPSRKLAAKAQEKLPARTPAAIAWHVNALRLQRRNNISAIKSHLTKHQMNSKPAQETTKSSALMDMLLLLNDARNDESLWNNLFTRAVEVVSQLYRDLKQLQTMNDTQAERIHELLPICKQFKQEQETKMNAKMDEIEEALKREVDVDRFLKKEA